MSLDKSIATGKEHRKPFRKSKAVDHTCRNHGTCAYCADNRAHRQARQKKSKIGVDLDDLLPSI
jgi:hypothetical protein